MDHHLFWLDAEHEWDIACDRLQWILRKKAGKVTLGKHTGEQRQKAVWFVGRKKATLLEPFTGDEPRYQIQLTAEARVHLDALPDTFSLFHDKVYSSTGKFQGWQPALSVVQSPAEAAPQFDLAQTGT